MERLNATEKRIVAADVWDRCMLKVMRYMDKDMDKVARYTAIMHKAYTYSLKVID